MANIATPPGPKGIPLIGHLFSMYSKPLEFLPSIAREYGDVVNFKIGPLNAFLINHPDYIQDILINNNKSFAKSRGLDRGKFLLGEGLITTSNAELHHRQRKLIQPAFHRRHIGRYGSVMADYSIRLQEKWEDGKVVDMYQEMVSLALSIVSKNLFGFEIDSEAKGIAEAWDILMKQWRRLVLPFSEVLDMLPLPSNVKIKKAQAQLDTIIYRTIDERRASGKDEGDLISMLLLALDEENGGGGMSDKQLHDEALTLLLAGYETMANALTWTWYLLAQYPDVYKKLQQELDSVLAGKIPAAEDMPRLNYTRMIFAESMRLYPPVWTVARRSVDDYKIGSYMIPANSLVFLSQYVMQRDSRYYSDPDVFMPERWIPSEESKRPRFSYFPFGGGARLCIGEQYAWMEGILVVATIAQKWDMSVAPGFKVELEPLVTLRPKNGVMLKLAHRKSE